MRKSGFNVELIKAITSGRKMKPIGYFGEALDRK